jgi:hypothetical protein
MAVSAPSSAVLGATATVDLSWQGLSVGPGQKHVGAISHGDATPNPELTIVNIDNDGDAGFEELCAEQPPEACTATP